MKRNIGDADRTARAFGGAAFLVVFLRAPLHPTAHLVTGVITVILFATALFGWSPIYALLRYSSHRPEDAAPLKRV